MEDLKPEDNDKSGESHWIVSFVISVFFATIVGIIIGAIIGGITGTILNDERTGTAVYGIIGLVCIILFTIIFQNAYTNQKKRKRIVAKRIKTLKDIYALTPIQFEEVIKNLFEKMGYEAYTTKKSGDEGIDLFLRKEDKKEIVQCKNWKNKVSVPTVREFYGAMMDKEIIKGYVITASHFTMPCVKFAAGKNIHLVDGGELVEWVNQYEIPVPERVGNDLYININQKDMDKLGDIIKEKKQDEGNIEKIHIRVDEESSDENGQG